MEDAYRIDDLHVDVRGRIVSRRGRRLPMGDTSHRVLHALIRTAPGYLSTERCIEDVWPDRSVGPEAVAQRIRLLRRALGDSARSPRYIETARGLGYRLKSMPEPHRRLRRPPPDGWGTVAVLPATGQTGPRALAFVSDLADLISGSLWHVLPPEAYDHQLRTERSVAEFLQRTAASHVLVTHVSAAKVRVRLIARDSARLIACADADLAEVGKDKPVSIVRPLLQALWNSQFACREDSARPASEWLVITGIMRALSLPYVSNQRVLLQLGELLKRVPASAIGHALLANLLLRSTVEGRAALPDESLARDHVEYAITLAPDNLTVRRLASMTTRLLGLHDQAETHALAAARSALHRDELMAAKIGAGNLEAAMQIAQGLTPNPASAATGVGTPSHDYQPLLRISCLLMLMDRWDDAHRWSSALVSHYPQSVLGLSAHANVLGTLGEMATARRVIARLRHIAPHWRFEDCVAGRQRIYPADRGIAARLYQGLENTLG